MLVHLYRFDNCPTQVYLLFSSPRGKHPYRAGVDRSTSVTMSRPAPFTNLPSEVTVLKTNAAAKKGPGAFGQGDTETIWPKPEFVSVDVGWRSMRYARVVCCRDLIPGTLDDSCRHHRHSRRRVRHTCRINVSSRMRYTGSYGSILWHVFSPGDDGE